MLRYVCSLCGYEYDPETGLPECGIPEGTEFEDLPEDFECPLCGASAEEFEPVERDDD
jgi:rubredoxin-NAD+ reductase